MVRYHARDRKDIEDGATELGFVQLPDESVVETLLQRRHAQSDDNVGLRRQLVVEYATVSP